MWKRFAPATTYIADEYALSAIPNGKVPAARPADAAPTTTTSRANAEPVTNRTSLPASTPRYAHRNTAALTTSTPAISQPNQMAAMSCLGASHAFSVFSPRR